MEYENTGQYYFTSLHTLGLFKTGFLAQIIVFQMTVTQTMAKQLVRVSKIKINLSQQEYIIYFWERKNSRYFIFHLIKQYNLSSNLYSLT